MVKENEKNMGELDEGMIRVVNIRNERYDVYIGRKGKGEDGFFGNPFQIGRDGDRNEVIRFYRDWFLQKVEKDMVFRQEILELKGKVLGCFCKPEACHGDVIKDWVERTAMQ